MIGMQCMMHQMRSTLASCRHPVEEVHARQRGHPAASAATKASMISEQQEASTLVSCKHLAASAATEATDLLSSRASEE